jgi:hypothetical protein
MKWLAAIAVILCAWLAYELTTDPYAPERDRVLALLESEASHSPGETDESERDLDYEPIIRTISIKPLWPSLVRPPRRAPRPKPKPNLEQMTRGLKVLTVISGANDDVQAIINDSRKRSQEIYKKGDKVRELTVDSFVSDGVILSYEGETIKLPF